MTRALAMFSFVARMSPLDMREKAPGYRFAHLGYQLLCGGLVLLVSVASLGGAAAQVPPADAGVKVPGFWDPRRRPERPDLSRVSVIRFLTEVDYPPFNFAGPDGNPQGFNVDLARLMCEELKVGCTIQMRRFETLIAALNENRGEAAIASLAATAEARDRKSTRLNSSHTVISYAVFCL